MVWPDKYSQHIAMHSVMTYCTHLEPLVNASSMEFVPTRKHTQDLSGLKVAHAYHTWCLLRFVRLRIEAVRQQLLNLCTENSTIYHHTRKQLKIVKDTQHDYIAKRPLWYPVLTPGFGFDAMRRSYNNHQGWTLMHCFLWNAKLMLSGYSVQPPLQCFYFYSWQLNHTAPCPMKARPWHLALNNTMKMTQNIPALGKPRGLASPSLSAKLNRAS